MTNCLAVERISDSATDVQNAEFTHVFFAICLFTQTVDGPLHPGTEIVDGRQVCTCTCTFICTSHKLATIYPHVCWLIG